MISAKRVKEENDYAYICSPSKEIICHFFSFQCAMTRAGTAFAPYVFDLWAENKPKSPGPWWVLPPGFPAWFWPDTTAVAGTKKTRGNVLFFHWARSANWKQKLPSWLASPSARLPCLHTRGKPITGTPAQACHRLLKTTYRPRSKQKKNLRTVLHGYIEAMCSYLFVGNSWRKWERSLNKRFHYELFAQINYLF